MSQKSRPILIAALSGRALARSAQAAGLPVVVLDVFGDIDMRACADDWARVGDVRSGIDPARVLEAAERLCPPDHCGGLVYGAGFEACPAVLSGLSEGRELLGNAPQVLASMGSPHAFFGLLARLGIPYPTTRYRRPRQADGWLAKRAGASGGGHVRAARQVADGCGYYFQRQVQGRVMSVLFLANGREASIIGISEQWHAAALQAQPYSYGGALSDQPVSQRLRAELSFAIESCVDRVGLRGLNSMDLVVAGDEFQVLEINARPTATAELYDRARRASLFGLHVQACRGQTLHHGRPPARMYGHLLVYAERGLRVRRGLQWPDWCSDRPPAETRIGAGEPLCTVHASGSSRSELHALLERRSRTVSAVLLAAARPPAVQRMTGSSPCPL